MDIPRLSQCYLCKGWRIENTLFKIEVPDQTGWIEKKACQNCLVVIGHVDLVPFEPEGLKKEGTK